MSHADAAFIKQMMKDAREAAIRECIDLAKEHRIDRHGAPPLIGEYTEDLEPLFETLISAKTKYDT